MNAKTAALVLGVIFILVGVLGYLDVAGTFDNPIVGAAPAAGETGPIFEVNDLHNYVHLGLGAVLIVAAPISMASMGLILVGLIYAVVAVLGFVMPGEGGMMLGMIHMNQNDHFLHTGLAVVLLAAGFLLPKGAVATAPGT